MAQPSVEGGGAADKVVYLLENVGTMALTLRELLLPWSVVGAWGGHLAACVPSTTTLTGPCQGEVPRNPLPHPARNWASRTGERLMY